MAELSAFYLIRLPADVQVELARRAGGHVSEDPCVGRIGERNMNQVVHPHPRVNGYSSHLRNLHCPLADNVAAQYFGGLPVGNELAKTGLAPVDNRARGRVEV